MLLAAAFNFAVHLVVPYLLPAAPATALAITAALLSAGALVFLMRRLVTHDVRQTMQAVSDGLLALTEGDHGLRLVCDREDEAGRLLGRFNTLADKLRGQHNDAYQRELLLDVVLGVHSMRLLVQSAGQSDRLSKALDTIEERATHLKVFLDGYASFARLPMPSKRSVTWRELLDGVEGLYAFRVVGELPATPVQVDPGQMQQVLINLLKNAHEAGGAADAVSISVVVGEGGTTLWVCDRGKGMTDEQLHNAVLPFYSTKKSGTGLGLALCREIIEAHGGILSLQRNADAGITVSCRLP